MKTKHFEENPFLHNKDSHQTNTIFGNFGPQNRLLKDPLGTVKILLNQEFSKKRGRPSLFPPRALRDSFGKLLGVVSTVTRGSDYSY